MAADGIAVRILKDHDTVNPLDPNDKTGASRRVHEFAVGQVVTLTASKANLYIKNGWAVAV
jgi:hypothetical protein